MLLRPLVAVALIKDRVRKCLLSGAQKTANFLTQINFTILISVVALLVSVANSYFSFLWHPQDFRVYLRFPEPSEIGTNTLTLDYLFSNMGNQATFIEDVSIIEFAINGTQPDSGGAELHVCEDSRLFRPDFLALIPLEFRRKLQMEGSSASFFTAVQPTKIFIDGSEAKSSSAAVEAGKMRVIGTTFETDPIPRDNYNTVVICPVIRFFDSRGRPVLAVCKGLQSTRVQLTRERGVGTVIGSPPGGHSGRLLPVSSLGACRSVRVDTEAAE